MSDPNDPLIDALKPILSRVRRDKVAVKTENGLFWTGSAKSGLPPQSLTRERMAKHLNGGPAYGVSPLNEGSSEVSLALLDFDSHKGEVAWPEMSATVIRVVETLSLAWGAEPILFRSSGGAGVHLYLLFPGPQDAYSVRQWLAEVLTSCGLASGTKGVRYGQVEVFPRQDSVPIGGSGNQFVLPLAGRGAPLTVEEISGMLEVQPREWLLTQGWPTSPPVPKRERPARAASDAPLSTDADRQALLDALDAIPNTGDAALGYDEWLSVVLAVHRETRADGHALERLRAWSARCSKHTDEELDKQWHYADADKPGGVGAGTVMHIAGRYGWVRPQARPDPDDFQVVQEHAAAPTGGLATPPTRRGVPQAKHLCTDQANANRLVAAYGSRVLVAAGRWHVWDGKRWLADEADVYRYACRLSAMVKEEAKSVVRKAKGASEGDGSAKRVEDAEAIAEALEKWSTRSEMKGTIEAAIGLARKMLTVDADSLDADPHLLNVRNGVVDLRTGDLLAHDPGRLMTKLADVDYLPDARHDAWDRAVRAICGGDKPEAEALAGFLQRWFGYCATGLTREQVFVVHWGDGSNGKSTIMDTISRVLGDYAGTAPPGLVAGGERDRHPTEIASLLGKRMVTAHETREGVQLREDFVKQATGSDKLSARYMREDFFEFAPTHKLQLLTNSKPVVKGQDHGIWRRVRLVRYAQRFGSADEVAEGKATAIRDLHLADMLRGDEASLQGVLAWIVKGAVEWFAGGLREPQAVIEAGEAYRLEQDRVRQWAMECCEVAPAATEPLTLGMGGLFPSYTAWCREGGYHGLGRQRFLDEIVRAFPGIRTVEAYGRGDSGARRKITQVQGIRLLPE